MFILSAFTFIFKISAASNESSKDFYKRTFKSKKVNHNSKISPFPFLEHIQIENVRCIEKGDSSNTALIISKTFDRLTNSVKVSSTFIRSKYDNSTHLFNLTEKTRKTWTEVLNEKLVDRNHESKTEEKTENDYITSKPPFQTKFEFYSAPETTKVKVTDLEFDPEVLESIFFNLFVKNNPETAGKQFIELIVINLPLLESIDYENRSIDSDSDSSNYETASSDVSNDSKDEENDSNQNDRFDGRSELLQSQNLIEENPLTSRNQLFSNDTSCSGEKKTISGVTNDKFYSNDSKPKTNLTLAEMGVLEAKIKTDNCFDVTDHSDEINKSGLDDTFAAINSSDTTSP